MGDSEDAECLDNWEDLDEGILDQKIEKMQISRTAIQNGITSSSAKLGKVILLNDDIRSRYMPPEPSVKILRRPTSDCCDNMNELKPKQPVKTLQQREMEYAEARLRILGEAQSPEEMLSPLDDSDDSEQCSPSRIQKIQTKTQILRPSDTSCGILRLPKGPDGTTGFNLRSEM